VIVVLDANVIVSAAFFSGKPNRCLRTWLGDRKFEIAVSPAILDEYEEAIEELSGK
jgi:predicted nucleic acid-binding protein